MHQNILLTFVCVCNWWHAQRAALAMYGDSNENEKNKLRDISGEYHTKTKNWTGKLKTKDRQNFFGVFDRQLQTEEKRTNKKKHHHHYHHKEEKEK